VIGLTDYFWTLGGISFCGHLGDSIQVGKIEAGQVIHPSLGTTGKEEEKEH
jgi:hypothetical protein